MALITRCPVCGTLFKVVPDQLRISEGWVRCGHCAEVFDASHDLQQSGMAHQAVPPVDALPEDAPVPEEPTVSLQIVAPELDVLLPPAPEPEELLTPESFKEKFEEDVLPVAEMPEELGASAEAAVRANGVNSDTANLVEEARGSAVSPDLKYPSDPDPDAVAYSFVRGAVPDTLASRPMVRWLGGGVAGLLLLMFGVQAVVHTRDRLAATWPDTRPGLQTLCAWLGCTVSPLRQIESVVIDSSTLSALQSGDAYRLSLVLKNQAKVDLAMPSIEFVLTDIDEQAVFRRVLSPAELGAASRILFAGREWTTSVDLRVTDGVGRGRVVGYRLLAFYP